MTGRRQVALAVVLSILLLLAASALASLTAIELVRVLDPRMGRELVGVIIGAMNNAFIALATFELALGIGIVRVASFAAGSDRFGVLVRRIFTRFVSVVGIALTLEGLIMVVRYSPVDLGRYLLYALALLLGIGVLLLGLAVLVNRVQAVVLRRPRRAAQSNPAASRVVAGTASGGHGMTVGR